MGYMHENTVDTLTLLILQLQKTTCILPPYLSLLTFQMLYSNSNEASHMLDDR